jgi:hypothetical protein
MVISFWNRKTGGLSNLKPAVVVVIPGHTLLWRKVLKFVGEAPGKRYLKNYLHEVLCSISEQGMRHLPLAKQNFEMYIYLFIGF